MVGAKILAVGKGALELVYLGGWVTTVFLTIGEKVTVRVT
jgi:hypothetical protein